MKVALSGFICLLLVIFIFSPFALAQEQNPLSTPSAQETISYETINPKDSYQYSLKRLKEKLTLMILSFSAKSKYNYYNELLKIRLAELKYVVDKKDISNIETTSQRYSQTAGELVDFVLKNKLSTELEKVKENLALQKKILGELALKFNDTTAEWRFIKHDLDYIDIYISQLSQ